MRGCRIAALAPCHGSGGAGPNGPRLASDQCARAPAGPQASSLPVDGVPQWARAEERTRLSGAGGHRPGGPRQAGVSLDEVYEQEPDPALGNGGLGRLAACFLELHGRRSACPASATEFATSTACSARSSRDGWQIEQPDDWMTGADPWEFPRAERTYAVSFGGRVEHRDQRAHWIDRETVLAVAFDRLVPGYDSDTVNTLRLWSPKATTASTCLRSTAAHFSTRSRTRSTPRRWAACSIRTTAPPRDESCACGSSTSSSPPPCRTCLHASSPRPRDWELLPRSRRHPPQRHASGPRPRRAHASAGRRARCRVGAGLGADPGDVRLHQSHPDAGGARDLAVSSSCGGCCRATRDHRGDRAALA